MLSDQRFCFTVRKIPVSFIQKRLLPDGGSGFFPQDVFPCDVLARDALGIRFQRQLCVIDADLAVLINVTGQNVRFRRCDAAACRCRHSRCGIRSAFARDRSRCGGHPVKMRFAAGNTASRNVALELQCAAVSTVLYPQSMVPAANPRLT